ncbi:MAG: Putrescine transport ATP-binding protein PotA [uncultured Thermoleophilia bacterium]|uniref:ABC-type quaternary amine transporter n=1 Tax=uncultured Thermoleophilia bacterium TaxID=1497501 RepID=A0A6J4UCV6_9ACTN|nr:MAG: Putrescine transport ATP-binding protein PotA [uncultured Thermoleophilia bacterium]
MSALPLPRAGDPDARPPALRIAGLRRSYGRVVAVDGIDLELRPGEMLTLLGPSGCGKTTVLRLVAGLEPPDAGTIEIAGRRVAGPGGSVPPERRNVGMVFQDYALFPHLSVADNIGYGIRRDPDRAVRVAELLELVSLPDAGERMPHELSGGMQQRVAIARALAPRPDVILLDEPFSNLDAALRTQLRGDLREILRAAGASAVLVTHDQEEALTLGDRMAVMVRGRIEQCAPPEIVYGEPATPFVATFVGTANLVHADCRLGVGMTRLGPIRLVGPAARPQGGALAVIRPEHVELEEAADGPAEVDAWRVVRRRFTGSEILLEVAAPDGLRLWCAAGPHVRRLRIGDSVRVRLREVETVAFTPSRGIPADAEARAAAASAASPAKDNGPAGESDSVDDPAARVGAAPERDRHRRP